MSCGAQLCWGSVPATVSLSLADPFPSLWQGCGVSGSSQSCGCRLSLGQVQGRRQRLQGCLYFWHIPFPSSRTMQQLCQSSCNQVASPAVLGAAVPMAGPYRPLPRAPSTDQVGAGITGVPTLLAAHPAAGLLSGVPSTHGHPQP